MSVVAGYLRQHKTEIAADWERAVVNDLEQLTDMDRGALIDHLPEVLDGLAFWVEGQEEKARGTFSALADGHALQRLGYGVELAVVTTEYTWLRHVILRHLLAIDATPEVRGDLLRLNEGLDRAVQLSIRRYTERRDYLRDRFVSILGHDLRNPLAAAAVAAGSMLRAGELGERDRKRAQTISRAIGRMKLLIQDVLDFARGHLAGGIPVSPRACDLGEVCRALAEEARGANPDRAIEVRCQGDLLGTFDRERALQALGNLLSNAIQHGEDPIVIEAREADDRGAVLVRVSNRGAPIPEARLAKLFDPFAYERDERKGGLGLGLYIVAQIARAHGGTCEVRSTPEETAFTLRLPRTPRQETPGRP